MKVEPVCWECPGTRAGSRVFTILKWTRLSSRVPKAMRQACSKGDKNIFNGSIQSPIGATACFSHRDFAGRVFLLFYEPNWPLESNGGFFGSLRRK
jgi:hypothetical protein